MAKLSREEHEVMELLGEAANKFFALPAEHPSDQEEFQIAVHAAQNIVLARVGLRARAEDPPIRRRPVGFAAKLDD